MSGCRHGGRDVHERPDYLKNFDAVEQHGRTMYVPRGCRFKPTRVDLSQHFDGDMEYMQTVVLHGVEFVRKA